jgi:hypothetical protein
LNIMKRFLLAGGAIAALVASVPAHADRTPSLQIRCDGMPDNVTAGETAARLLGAVTLLGLFAPNHETPDEGQRLTGAEGVAVCAQALAVESNDIRRAQLLLASAIHHIEASEYDAAIAEARRVESDRPTLAQTQPYRRSLALSAMEIEALALLSAGRVEEARTRAFEMADASPYDLINQVRAWPYVRLTTAFGAREQAYFERLIRIYPSAVVERAALRQSAGDFRGAAEDYEIWLQFAATLDAGPPGMAVLAQAALAHALAGDTARAEARAGEARTALTAAPESTSAQPTTEILDLYQIWKNAHDGRAAEARVLFANRTAWLRPSAGAVAEVARQLQLGAAPESLTGSLAGEPGRFRTELVTRRRQELTGEKNRFALMRPFYPQASYDRFASNVWRTDRSRYFGREENAQLHATSVSVLRDGGGTPASYALLLHTALTARAQGKNAFMVMPGQQNPALNFVRIGNRGDAAMIGAMTMDAERVIADLSPVIPRPPRR